MTGQQESLQPSDAAQNPSKARSREQVVAPSQLDQSISDTLQQPEYSWRLPRAERQREVGLFEGFVASIGDTIAHWIKAFGRWIGAVIDKLMTWIRPPVSIGTPGVGWVVAVRTMVFVLLVVLLFFLLMYVFRLWQRSRRGANDSISATSVQPVPDLTDHNIGADQLPEDEWIKLGRDLLQRGELRLAMRAYYLASLAHLAQRNLITLAKYKSNYDYGRELRRRAHALPELMQSFEENVTVFDRSWYGLHDIDQTLLSRFQSNVERIKNG